MKVLMLGWEFPPRISGGLGVACQGIVHGLAAEGVEVVLVVPRARGGEERSARAAGAASVRSIASPLSPYLRPEQYAGAARSVLAPPPGGAYGPDLFAEVERYAQRVSRLARRERFDLVHAHDWMAFPAGMAAARARRRPLVVHVHACEHDRNPERPDAHILAIESAGLSAADRVVCVSRYTAGVLERRFGLDPAKLRVVHNGVAPGAKRRSRGTRSPHPLVLFLGRVTAQKGPELFLEAAARVLRLEREVRFVVCGTGDLLPAVIERAALLGIAQRARFTGFLEREEVERVLDLADLLVMPSLSEPFGLAPLEAAARGVPVIVPRHSGVAEVLAHAIKVDPWDVEALAGRILALLRYPALRRWLGEGGRREAASLRWESRGARLREVFAEVAG